MNRKTKVERVAIADFVAARSKLEVNLKHGLPDFSVFAESDPPTQKQQEEYCERVIDELKNLEDLEGATHESPYLFNSKYDIPERLIDQWSIKHTSEDKFFLFRGRIYLASGPHTEEEFQLLVFKEAECEDREFAVLKSKYVDSGVIPDAPEKYSRDTIPQRVRREVWRRDQGMCVKCDSRERLEFDHIIPVAKGGGNTVRNIELLCESCNRKKGVNIE